MHKNTYNILHPRNVSAYRSSHVDFALADDKLMDNILVTVPAGKLERSPTIFSLLVYIAFHWHQHSDDTSMAI